MAPCFNRRVGGSFAIELQKRPFDHGLGVLIDKTAVRRGALLICALALTSLSIIDSVYAYSISVDARAGVRGCSGAFDIETFSEIDGAVSSLVEADSSGCSGAASVFAEADLAARTVRAFNTSTTEGASDAYAELGDIYFITEVPDDVLSVDIGLSVSFTGTVEGLEDGGFRLGRLLGRVGQFEVDVPFDSGGTFTAGGIQTFNRLVGGGFNRIDIVLLIDSIELLGAGTVDFSSTGSIDFDLSLLPSGADLVSESGFSVRAGQVVIPGPIPEPSTILLFGTG